MTRNIYANVESIVEAIILDESNLSSVINCSSRPDDLTGTKACRILKLPEGFPVCSITFVGAFEIDEDGELIDPAILTVSDAVDTGIITVQSIAVENGYGQMIQLYAFWFDAVNYFKIKTSATMTEDFTFQVALQPIYQGVPS